MVLLQLLELIIEAYITLLWTGSGKTARSDLLKYVDPLIGTANGGNYATICQKGKRGYVDMLTKCFLGHAFAGASLPFSM